MTITLAEAAARQIRTQIAKRGQGSALRVGVKADGTCGCGESFNLKAVKAVKAEEATRSG